MHGQKNVKICASQFSKRLSNINLVVKVANILNMSFVSSSKNHVLSDTGYVSVVRCKGEKKNCSLDPFTNVQSLALGQSSVQ